MKKKTIYIAIEIKVREFIAKLLFSFFAIQKNYRIYLGSKDELIELIKNKKQKGGLFFYKGGLQVEKTKQIHSKTDAHIVLDEEMTAGLNKEKYKRQAFFSKAKKYIHAFIYINEEIKRIVEKSMKTSNIYALGWPRVDLYKKPYSDVYISQEKKIKKKYGNFYLFMSDFAYITKNYRQHVMEHTPWGGGKKYFKYWKNYTLSYAENTFEEYRGMIKFFNEVSKKDKNIKIVIRGHPSESVKEWKKNLRNLKNFIFTKPIDDPQPWITASNGVLHRGCSTSLQAFALNKPIGFVRVKTKKGDKFIKKKPYQLSFKINNYDDFIVWKNKDFKKNKISLVSKELNLGKKTSSEKIINYISKLKINSEEEIFEKKEKEKFFAPLFFYFQEIKKFIYFCLVKFRLLDRNLDKFYYVDKIPNGITKKEASFYLNNFNKKKKFNIKIKQVKNNIISIESF